MAIADELKEFHGESGPERKLQALRRILVRPVVTVNGVASLLKQVEPDCVDLLHGHVQADELDRVIEWLSDAGCDLQAIVDALAVEDEEVTA